MSRRCHPSWTVSSLVRPVSIHAPALLLEASRFFLLFHPRLDGISYSRSRTRPERSWKTLSTRSKPPFVMPLPMAQAFLSKRATTSPRTENQKEPIVPCWISCLRLLIRIIGIRSICISTLDIIHCMHVHLDRVSCPSSKSLVLGYGSTRMCPCMGW